MSMRLMSGGSQRPGDGDFNLMVRNLRNSDLTPDDQNARPIENAERAATATSSSSRGYVLPYCSADGRVIPFYRVPLLDADAPYKQPKDTPYHVYCPKYFPEARKARPNLII